MAAQYKSKHGTVSRSPYEMYLMFADLRNFERMVPGGSKVSMTAEYDRLKASVQGFDIGVKVLERQPYSLISYTDDGAPFHFTVSFHFSPAGDSSLTDFSIEVEADLNIMMKMMLGSKIQEALDKLVQSLVDASEGRMPEGFDPSKFNM